MEGENAKTLVTRDFTDHMLKTQESELMQISKGIIKDETSYKAFLSFLARGNIGLLQYQIQALIYSKRSTATIINTYRMWKNYGFQVKAGENGIRVPRNNGGRMALFDISQTINLGGYDEKKLSWDMELAGELGYTNHEFSYEYLAGNNYIEMAVEKIHNIFSEYTEDKLQDIDSFAATTFLYLINERLGVDNGHIHFGKMPDIEEYDLLSSVISEITAKAYHDLNTMVKRREKYVPKDKLSFEIIFSESQILYDSDKKAKDTDKYISMSFALANKVIGQLDSRQHRERAYNEKAGYYNKTFYRINAVIDGKGYEYEGRIDIGDDTKEDLLAYMKESLEYNLEVSESEDKRASVREYLDILVPFLDKNKDLSPEDIKSYRMIMERADEFYKNLKDKQEGTVEKEKEDINNKLSGINGFDNTSSYNIKMTDEEIEEILEADRRIAEEKYEEKEAAAEKSIGRKRQCKLNIEAIRTMKSIEKENRAANKEEIEIMKKYSGWGGIQEVFDERNTSWNREYNDLKELLTQSEYEEARSSVNSAFYTDNRVIKAIYKVIERMGFKGGKILEPAMGTGRFFLNMPESWKYKSRLYGVEKDSITGIIAKLINPDADIQIKGFEETGFEKNTFDMVIGNIPFGDFSVYDTEYRSGNYKIHDYFMIKSLDLVREGGIAAIITSKGTLDKNDTKVRSILAKKAELAGAIRLPSGTFGDTAVTSDILFFIKRKSEEIFYEPEWIDVMRDSNDVPYNRYYHINNNNMLGEMHFSSIYGGKKITELAAYDKSRIFDDLNMLAMHMELSAEYTPRQQGEVIDNSEGPEVEEKTIIPADSNVKNFTYAVIDGIVYIRKNDIMEEVLKSDRNIAIIKGYIAVRDTVNEIIEAQKRNCTDEELFNLQNKLNSIYDSFVEEYGYITDSKIENIVSEDIEYYMVKAIELREEKEINGRKETFYKKAEIFSMRTIRNYVEISSTDNIQDAVNASMAKYGNLNIKYMSELMKKSNENIMMCLVDEHIAFFSPERYDAGYDMSKCFIPKEEYLSGNVRVKRRNAEEFTVKHPDIEYLKYNVSELTNVIPEWITSDDIKISIGAGIIRLSDYEKFADEFTGIVSDVNISRVEMSSTYFIQNKARYGGLFNCINTYGTKRMPALSIYETLLNKRMVEVTDATEDYTGKKKYVKNEEETIKANEKAEEIKQFFEKWLFADEERKAYYEEKYNELYNSEVLAKYDGSYINIPYMNNSIELKEHQKNAIARILRGNTMLAHDVGAGKTYVMAAAAMEMRRLKTANKPMIVVPNNLVGQFAGEFMRLFPSAHILVTTDKDFETKRRKVFISKIAMGDYDAVIIGHSQFQKIGLSQEKQEEEINYQIKQLENMIKNSNDNFTIKVLENKKKKYKYKLEKLMNAEYKDQIIPFENLGIDALFVDEAHEFKNLDIETKMTRMAGIQTASSQKAMDLYTKVKYIREQKGEQNVVFATGTPLSNTICEMYTWQKYLNESDLYRKGINNFDDWVSMFGMQQIVPELAPEGNHYQLKAKISKFRNIPELRLMFNKFVDIKKKEELNLNIPRLKNGKYVIVEGEPNSLQKKLMEKLIERADDIRAGAVSPRDDNMLAICHDARLLAVDPRLLLDDISYSERSKLDECVDNVYRIYMQSSDNKGTQVIFSDIGTPTSGKEKGFNVYDYLKDKLTERGVPADEICFIHDAKKDKDKLVMQEAVRKGEKRIIIGSTKKLGTGTNIQNRLIAEHDLDVPWRPSDIEQREGRILRQGNMNNEVEIYRYVTKGTFDAYNWNIIENKQYFVSQVLFSEAEGVREHEDISDSVLKYAEFKAVASGNPHVKEKLDIDAEIKRLEILKRSHNKDVSELQREVDIIYPEKIYKLEQQINNLKADDIQAKNNIQDKFCIEIKGVMYSDKNIAGEKIISILKSEDNLLKTQDIGKYRGFKLEGIAGIEKIAGEMELELKVRIKGSGIYSIDMSEATPIGVVLKIDNLLRKIPEFISNYTKKLEIEKNNLKLAKEKLLMPFSGQEKLDKLYDRQKELEKELFEDKANIREETGSRDRKETVR